MATSQVTDVPPAKVGQQVQLYVNGKAKQIECEKQPDGNWTITAKGLPEQ